MTDRRIACVTGGTSGIGRGIVEQFLAEDYFVYAIGLGHPHAQELEEAHPDHGGDLHIMVGDVRDPRFTKTLGDTIEKRHEKLDVLVNSAGKLILSPKGGGINEPLDIWREVFEVNLFSAVNTTQSLYPLLKEGRNASVINISTVCSLHPFDTCTSNAYSTSKAGLDLLTQRLAQQLARDKIRVNSINPGVVYSNIMETAGMTESQQNAFRQKILERRHPLGRLGNPPDIAHAASYLASDRAEWITGVILPVDGGYSVS